MAKEFDREDPEIAEGIADYDGNEADWKSDNCVTCVMCRTLWVVGFPDMDTTGLAKVDDGWVCEGECEDEYAEYEAEDMAAEHGTLYAKGGSVVG